MFITSLGLLCWIPLHNLISRRAPSMPPRCLSRHKHKESTDRGPQSQQKSPAGPPPPTVHMHTAALHNRVTEEIKRTVLLQGCVWLSSLTHILSSNNGALQCLTEWPQAGLRIMLIGKASKHTLQGASIDHSNIHKNILPLFDPPFLPSRCRVWQ